MLLLLPMVEELLLVLSIKVGAKCGQVLSLLLLLQLVLRLTMMLLLPVHGLWPSVKVSMARSACFQRLAVAVKDASAMEVHAGPTTSYHCESLTSPQLGYDLSIVKRCTELLCTL